MGVFVVLLASELGYYFYLKKKISQERVELPKLVVEEKKAERGGLGWADDSAKKKPLSGRVVEKEDDRLMVRAFQGKVKARTILEKERVKRVQLVRVKKDETGVPLPEEVTWEDIKVGDNITYRLEAEEAADGKLESYWEVVVVRYE